MSSGSECCIFPIYRKYHTECPINFPLSVYSQMTNEKLNASFSPLLLLQTGIYFCRMYNLCNSCSARKEGIMTKQLSLSERIVIERMISSDFTFATIARHLHRSPSTISREVRNHRGFVEKFTPPGKNDCVKRHSCLRNNICDDVPVHGCYFYRCKKCPDRSCFKICTAYVSERCPKLDKPPYVCTHCEKRKDCKHIHAYYTAHRAHAEYTKQLSSARSGIRKTREELEQIERIIEPLIKRGQSPAHICATHGSELGISERTLYNYIDSCAFKVRNIDLPKKVAYRRRRKKKVLTRFEYKCRMGRTYEDFKS